MTKKFDDKARAEYLSENNFANLEYNGLPVRDMIVKPMSVKEARRYIATYHYSKSMPDSTKFVFAGYYDDKLAGIIVYGMGAGRSQYTALIPTIEKGQYLEITRLWSPDSMPKNTESKLISESMKLLPKEYKLIVTFADQNRKHRGIIYQATNSLYTGETTSGKVLVTEDGTIQHTRLLGIYKNRHKELKNMSNKEIMELYKWTYKDGSKKHRYVYLRGSKVERKRLFKFIEPKIKKYPKGDIIV